MDYKSPENACNHVKLRLTEARSLSLLSPPQPVLRPTSRFAVTVIAIAALVALLYYGRDFFITLIIAAIFAFILDPAVLLVMKARIPRAPATAIVIGLAFIGLYVVSAVAWSQIATIAEDLPAYTARLSDLWGKANSQLDGFEQRSVSLLVPKSLIAQGEQIQQKPQEAALKSRRRRAQTPGDTVVPPVIQEVRVHSDPKPIITTIYGYLSGYFHIFVMASFVPFLVYFMLSWRDHISKSVMRLFPGEKRYTVGKTWSGIGDSTRAYVLGNFLLWVLLSLVSCLAFFLLGVPYWLLVGPVSAFFSLAPYVGLPLAVLPPVMAAVAIPNRFKIILSIIFIATTLHFVAMNFLYPKIVGRRVHVNPLVVTISLMFWGVMWGGIGLILAVPITAAIKSVCDNVESLAPYGKLMGD